MSAAGLLVAAVNGLWQSALLAIAAAAALRCVRANASARATVWTVMLLAAAALTPLDLGFALLSIHQMPAWHAQIPQSHIASPHALQNLATVLPAMHRARFSVALLLSSSAERWALPLVALWMAMAAYSLVRLVMAAAAASALKRGATALGDSPAATALTRMATGVRRARVAMTDAVETPCALGFTRPMVLLPRTLLDRLEPADLYAVVAHELAHLQRADDVVQVFQRIVLAIFFFNPVLHIVSRRIDFYRELACDDRVISSRASALRYAECLATILERMVVRRNAFAPAFLQGPTQVSARVQRLVNWKEGPHSMGRVAILIALAVCVTALFFVRVELPFLSTRTAPNHNVEAAVLHRHTEDDDTLLGALAAAGYRITTDDLVALANAGVDRDLIVAIHRSGLILPSPRELIELSNAGVDEDLIAAAARAFGSDVSSNDLLRLQNNGLGADDVADLCTHGMRNLSVSDVIALHDAGVDGDYIRHVVASTRGPLSASDIIRLHEAGVDS